MDLRNYIRDVLDFKPGITFFDITPLLADLAQGVDERPEVHLRGRSRVLAAMTRHQTDRA
jgi:hypothetical protein